MVDSDQIGRMRRERMRATIALVSIALGSLSSLLGSSSPAAAHEAIAHATRTLNGSVTAHLHLLRANGSDLIEEGPVSGALTGSASAQVHTGSVFRGNFTIHTSRGSITGKGTATPHGSGRYQSFSGSFLVVGGSDRFVHISGRAGLYGVFDRRTDSVVIQTSGRFTY